MNRKRERAMDTWPGTLAEYLHESLVGHEQEHLADLRAAADRLRATR
jgi:hypothetical protein